MSSESSSSSAGNSSSSSSAKQNADQAPKDRKFLCHNCGKEGHPAYRCEEPRDQARIFANANKHRAPAALAEKKKQAEAEKAQRAAIDARLERIEKLLQASVPKVAISAPAIVVSPVVDVNYDHRAFVYDAIEIELNPAAPPAAEAVAVCTEGLLRGCSLPPTPEPIIVDVLSDAKVQNWSDKAWQMADFVIRGLFYACCILLFCLGFALCVGVPEVAVVGAACLNVIGWRLWWIYRPKGVNSKTYQLIGSAYISRGLSGDRRFLTFRTCPIESPDFVPDAKYLQYRVYTTRDGKSSSRVVIISHELFLEASAPKNKTRYVSADSLKTCYSDTLSFLRTHGHVNLDRDLEAEYHILHNTAEFFAFKLRCELCFDDVESVNEVSP